MDEHQSEHANTPTADTAETALPEQEPASRADKGGPAKMPNINSLFSRTWTIYKRYFWTFIAILLVPAVGALLTGFGAIMLEGDEQTSPFAVIAFFLVMIAIFVTWLWSQVALFIVVRDRSEHVGFKAAFARAWGHILSYIWVGILNALVVAGGFALLIVPGIIFWIWFSLSIAVFITEDKRGMNALLASREYIRGYWWPVLGRILLVGGIAVAIALVFGLLGLLFGAPEATMDILSPIINIIVGPFMLTYTYLIYEDLRALKGPITPRSGKAGFIVIAVIGFMVPLALLASVVLASLNHVREQAEMRGTSDTTDQDTAEPSPTSQ